MATLIDDREAEVARWILADKEKKDAANRHRFRIHECDESESAAARALLAQIEHKEPAPSADPLIWIVAGVLALVIALAAGMMARL